MALNLALLKKHPYATGGVVIVGGLVVFYLLSRQGSSAATSGTGENSDYAAELAANSAAQQAQAAVAVQTNAQQAQVTVAQLNAQSANLQTSAAEDVTDTQTVAQLLAQLDTNSKSLEVTQSNNDASTLQQQNQLQSEQNIYSLQEGALTDQYNQATIQQENNNATNLAGLVDQLNFGALEVGDVTQLQAQKETDAAANAGQIDDLVRQTITQGGPQAGATAVDLAAVGAGGSPVFDPSSTQIAQASASAYSSLSTASIIASATKAGTSVLSGLFG